MYACVCIPDLARDRFADLRSCAEAFSPHVEFTADAAILDARGLRKLYGPPASIGMAIAQRVADSLKITGARVAIAANSQAALAAARGFPGLTVIPPGEEHRVLSSLPLDLLPEFAGQQEMRQILTDWGIRTFSDLAALPEDGLAGRLGGDGVRLRTLALGAGDRPLIPEKDDLIFEAGMELDHGLVLLEPLLFVLSRLLNEICAGLASHSLAANELNLRLALERAREYERTLRIPFAARDPQTFLKLLQYGLTAHPPGAPVTAVHLRAVPVPPRSVQGGLFIPLSPQPEKLEIALARIAAIVGEDNIGSPELLDTHRPDAFRLVRFIGREAEAPASLHSSEPRLAMRIYRPPVPAKVIATEGRPERITARCVWGSLSGSVIAYAGPWRSSGDWIASAPWARDEWDVALQTGGVYRLRREPGNHWYVDGNYD